MFSLRFSSFSVFALLSHVSSGDIVFSAFLDLRSLDIAAARAFSLGGSVVGGRHQDIDHNLIEKEARRDSARQIIDTINSESLIQRK